MRVLAIDIGGTAIKYGVVDEKGIILEHYEIPTEAHLGGENLLKRIIEKIKSFKDIQLVGISSAGQIDSIKGEVIYASKNIPGWIGTKIKKEIEEACNIEVYVENDVKCAAIGEMYCGSAKGIENFLCIAYGTGVGGAIIHNGEIYKDLGYSAGQFGHSILYPNGRECKCGIKGCYEAYASTTALVNRVSEELKIHNSTGRKIICRMESGDKEIKEIVHQWLDDIIIGLTSFVHILNPGVLILGGGVMENEYILNYIKSNLPQNILPAFKGIRIIGASLGNKAAIIGASRIAINNIKNKI